MATNDSSPLPQRIAARLSDWRKMLDEAKARGGEAERIDTAETVIAELESLAAVLTERQEPTDMDAPMSVHDALERVRTLVKSEAGHIAYLDDELDYLVATVRKERQEPQTCCGKGFPSVAGMRICRLPAGHDYAHHSRPGDADDFTWANDEAVALAVPPPQETPQLRERIDATIRVLNTCGTVYLGDGSVTTGSIVTLLHDIAASREPQEPSFEMIFETLKAAQVDLSPAAMKALRDNLWALYDGSPLPAASREPQPTEPEKRHHCAMCCNFDTDSMEDLIAHVQQCGPAASREQPSEPPPSLLAKELEDRDYRDAYSASLIDIGLPFQIRALRLHFGWTQQELADRAGMAQSRIAELEAAGKRRVNVETLLRLGQAFDLGVQVRFTTFAQLTADDAAFDPENHLRAESAASRASVPGEPPQREK